MPAVTCLGDMTAGHCFQPVPAVEGSANVFIGGKAVVLVGSKYPPHTCGKQTHQGMLAQGSSSVFINGKAVGRVGDKLSCGDTVAQGSPSVFIGG